MTRIQLINKLKTYIDTGMWKYEACPLNKEDIMDILEILEDVGYYRELLRTNENKQRGNNE